MANKVRPHALVHGRTVDNINVPLLVDDDGTLQTAGGGGGGSGPVTVADGADVVEGELADAKVLGDNAGTISAKLRGLNHIWNDVWDSVSHRLKVTPDLPALASTSTKQSDGTQKTQVVDGSGNVIGATANALDVNIKSGAGSGGTALADEAAFSQGTTQITPIGGLFKAAYTALTTGMAGVLRITAGGAAYANIDQVQGTNVDVNSGSKSAGTIRVVLATDQPALTNKLLVTPDSVALPANQSTNVSQIAGTTADTNSGTKSAGTLRVVLATDQPALTNKLLVTPDSVALPANQSVNAAQLAGTTTDTNSGNKSAGTLRVVLATDQPALTNKLLVTPDSVALPANQSVNVSQINAVTPLMGAGNTGTGSLRVTIATDQAQLTNKLLVTPDANSAVNVAQMNGVATSMGAGASGTGVQRVTLASDDPAVATLGATTGAKVITDANGTIQQYLRGIIYQMITAGATFFTPVPTTSGGWSVFNATSGDGSTALTNSAQVIKGSAGQLGGWYIYNPNVVVSYVPIYNVAAASVTVGTTNPLMVLAIPALSAANLEVVMGIAFSNAGFSCAATTTAAGNTAPATALDANFWYK